MTEYPQEGDLVIATVNKIHYHSIFCNLDEYENLSGMLHISEVAPGRIRNINEYVKEGKVVIVKVLRVDKNKGHIDLSLRRVTEAQRKQKAASRKQEALVENIITQIAKTTDTTEEKLLETLTKQFPEDALYDVFVEVVEGDRDLTALDLNDSIRESLIDAIKDRISPKIVSIKANITIKTYAPDGVEQIKKAFSNQAKAFDIYYAGAGVYSVEVSAKEYKVAEELLKTFREHLQESLPGAEIGFERADK
jgi:translation initiation factor 2 subunit 1